jgi:CrcB protein
MRTGWTGQRAAAVAAGGVLGATLRWVIAATWPASGFPWTILAINVAGSILLGMLLAEEWAHPTRRLLLHDFGGIGFCGALTTFSTFSIEVVNLASDDHVATASWYVVASVTAAILGAVAGAAALRRVRALALPLEEQP